MPLSAAELTGVETGADFLKYGIGGRASAMGEAYVSECSDVTAGYWNPAGLSMVKNYQVGAMHSEAIFDTSLEYLGAAVPVEGAGTLGAGAIFMFYEPVPVTLSSDEKVGELKWMDWSAYLSFARQLIEGIHAGAGVKIIQKQESNPIFGESKGTAYAADMGIIAESVLLKDLRLGFSSTNLGKKIQMEGEKRKDNLPETTRLGASYSYRNVTGVAEASRVLNDVWRVNVGGEVQVSETTFARAGHFSKAGGLEGVTYGLGFIYGGFTLDWANLPSGELVGAERENRVSLIFEFQAR